MTEQKTLGDLAPNSKNPRKITAPKLEALKASLAKFGDLSGIIYNRQTKRLAGGHQRRSVWDAASAVEIVDRYNPPTATGTVQTGYIEVDGERYAYREVDWDEATEMAANIAANKGAGEWDMEALGRWFKELEGLEFDLDLTMFDASERKQLLAPVGVKGKTDPDEVPENVATRCKLGDLWVLGGHRLLCGDSTNVQHVERLMGNEKASVWLSDPPYGINHVEVSQEKGQSKGYGKIVNDDLQDEEFKNFIFKVIEVSLPHMKKGFAFYMWHAMKMQGYTAAAAAAAAAAGILFHRQIIWVKPQLVFGRGHYHWRHELCLMGWLRGDEPPFYGERDQTTVWECKRENDKVHPTQKPIGLLEPAILNHTRFGESIYEPFTGSGSTLIACEKTGRRCFGMEIDPHYCDVIITRWENFTGQKATLLTDDFAAEFL